MDPVLCLELFPNSYNVFRRDRDLITTNKYGGGKITIALKNAIQITGQWFGDEGGSVTK